MSLGSVSEAVSEAVSGLGTNASCTDPHSWPQTLSTRHLGSCRRYKLRCNNCPKAELVVVVAVWVSD